MNYEFNLLHHVGVVARRVREAAADTAAAHDSRGRQYPGPRGKKLHYMIYDDKSKYQSTRSKKQYNWIACRARQNISSFPQIPKKNNIS